MVYWWYKSQREIGRVEVWTYKNSFQWRYLFSFILFVPFFLLLLALGIWQPTRVFYSYGCYCSGFPLYFGVLLFTFAASFSFHKFHLSRVEHITREGIVIFGSTSLRSYLGHHSMVGRTPAQTFLLVFNFFN